MIFLDVRKRRSTGAFHPGDLVLACVSGGADSVTSSPRSIARGVGIWTFVQYTSTTKFARQSAGDAVFVKAVPRLGEPTFASPRSPSRHPIFRQMRDNGVEMRQLNSSNRSKRMSCSRVIMLMTRRDDAVETPSRVSHISHRRHASAEGAVAHVVPETRTRRVSRVARKHGVKIPVTVAEVPESRARRVDPLRELVDKGGVESRVEALTEQSAHLRELLDEMPSAYLAHGDGPVASDSPFDRSYLVRGEIDLDFWSRLPTLAREDQLRTYVSDCAGVDMEYHVLRKMCAQLFARANADVNTADAPEWEWRIRGDWVLHSVGTRAWAAKKPRLDLRANEGKQTSGANDGDGDAEAQDVGNEVIVDAGRGVSITHPPGWLVRTSWENSTSIDSTEEGVRLANLPDKCALQLRFRQPGDAFRPGHSRRVKLKDWMRGNDVPLHARDRTPLVCLGDDIWRCIASLQMRRQARTEARRTSGTARGNMAVDCVW